MATHLVHAWVQELEHQLYVWRVPPAPTTSDLDESLKAIRAWIRRLDEPYGWVTDPRALRISTVALERKMLADHLREVEPYSVRFCRGMATIVTNPMVRGIGTAIAWMYAYPFPVTYCASEPEALIWVRHQMRHGNADVGPPPGPRRS